MAAAGPHSRRGVLLLTGAAVLLVLMPFLFWQQTWFGRRLTDQDLAAYLQDDTHARKIQHALSQIADRILQGDETVQSWYPQIVRLSRHRLTIIRSTAAWVMGQDNRSAPFHRALLDLLADPEPIVRRNAALALVRFQDASGRAELVSTLLPSRIPAPAAGTVSMQSQAGRSVEAGSSLARIRTERGQEVDALAPFSGRVSRLLCADGSRVAAGDFVLMLSADSEQIREALRGLYLVGRTEDLAGVEPYERDALESVRQQAVLTARAIRSRELDSPVR